MVLLRGLGDLRPALEKLKPGAVLSLEDLKVLRGALLAMDLWLQFPVEDAPGLHLQKALEALEPIAPLLVSVERVLTPEGEISEKASSLLRSLTQEINSLQQQIQQEMGVLIGSLAQQGVLQDRFHDQRDGRYVLPVKVSHQGEVDGLIYDSSVSGQTVFIEPRQVEILNNRLRKAQNEKQQEIYRILAQLSAEVLPYRDALLANFMILLHWDQVQARAPFGSRLSWQEIQVDSSRDLSLEFTSHPLLWGISPKKTL